MTDPMQSIVTVERHIRESQRAHPEAKGRFSQLLNDFALAGKLIAHSLRRAVLADVLGHAGSVNVQGEEQKKLDVLSNEILIEIFKRSGRVGVIASEEEDEVIPIDGGERPYAIVFDPLDGSSNTEVNVSLGTIFGIYRRKDPGSKGTREDVLRPGREMLAAGYILYGPCTNLVYSVGDGVHGFTLDPDCGEFLLSHSNIRFPEKPKYYSANQGGETTWSESVQRYVRWLRGMEDAPPAAPPLSTRYVGTLVVDFHRNLIDGGVFLYPMTSKKGAAPKAKLRQLYELAPLAFLAEQAGGASSNGVSATLDIQPTDLHQREAVFIGDRELVRRAEEFLAAGSA